MRRGNAIRAAFWQERIGPILILGFGILRRSTDYIPVVVPLYRGALWGCGTVVGLSGLLFKL